MASPIEQFANTVRALYSHDSLRTLCDYLNKSTDVLLKNVQHLDNVLETLNMQQHSLAILAILCAKLSGPSAQQENSFTQVQDFILNCNGEQIRYAPDTFAELCHLFTNYLVEKRQPLKGIGLLQKAVSKLRLFETQLTSIHADLCHLCLLAKCFKPALQLLDIDITGLYQEVGKSKRLKYLLLTGLLQINSSTAGPHFDAKYFLLYYYYGGMIYLAVRNLDRALYFFEVAITIPSHAVSHIMLESYKKYILVSLLLHGKSPNMPKYTSQVVTRFIKPLSQPYHDLANAFTSNNTAELNAVLNKHSEVFTRDHNMGLVKQVSSVLYKKNIQRLTKTFLTLSLSDVASRVGLASPAEAEGHILQMIENQQIFATINQKDGMVVFRDEPDKYGGPDVLKGLEELLQLCMELDKQILAMDEEMQVNPQYVKKAAGLQDEEPCSKSTYAM